MLRTISIQSPAIKRIINSTTVPALILVPLVVGVLLIAPPLIGAAAIVGTASALLLVVHPFLIPVALIASVPVQDLLPVPEGVPLTVTRAAVVAGAGISLFLVVAQRRALQFHWLMLPVTVYISVMGLSLWNASDLAAGYAEIYRWTVALFGFWLILQFVRTRAHVLATFAVFAFMAVAQALVGGIQAVFGLGPSSFAISDNLYRGYGSFGMPNSYAAFMEAVSIPLLPVAIWSLSETWS
jgi:hypothetical protein